MRKLKNFYKKSCNYFKYIIQLYCHNKQDIMTLNESYYSKWYSIVYRVDEGLHYNENRLDTYFTLISMKEY